MSRGKLNFPESPFANRSGGDYESFFKAKLLSDPTFVQRVLECHGKRLGCWCKDRPDRDFSKCHGHLVARWADRIHEKWQELKLDKIALRQWMEALIGDQKPAGPEPPTIPTFAADIRC
jgi:hypothetical protein